MTMASARRLAATRPGSPRAPALLLDRDVAEQLDLVHELDPVLLARAPARLRDERERVLGAGAAGVLDEVRVLGRDLRAADAMALEPAGLEHPPRAQVVVRVLEDAPERAPVRRLCFLAPRVQLAHGRLDLLRGPRRQPQLRLEDDVAVSEVRVPVGQPQLRRGPPPGAVGGPHEPPLQHLREGSALPPAVHPDAAADRPWDRARELEAA